jgi:hypothetical protein
MGNRSFDRRCGERDCVATAHNALCQHQCLYVRAGPLGGAVQLRFSAGARMNRLAKIGATALKIYTCHILVFAIGACLGAVTAFVVLTPYIVAAAQ